MMMLSTTNDIVRLTSFGHASRLMVNLTFVEISKPDVSILFFSQHEDANAGRHELSYLEEERVRVLARVDELKNRLMELEQQLQESKQEVRQRRNPWKIV